MNLLTPYQIGALLYCPANNQSIATSLIQEHFGKKFSLALCLEDTIKDEKVIDAEIALVQSLQTVYNARQQQNFFLPKIFIRIRTAGQMTKLTTALGTAAEIVTGFILPKIFPDNTPEYLETICEINKNSHCYYIMPIIENPAIVDLRTRWDILYNLKGQFDPLKDFVLNIRVGGNDLCNVFGFRRHCNETIYDLQPVSQILSDIVTVFGDTYIVSGPVWEYYNGDGWERGLSNELEKDRAFGFIGKTVIHPHQISPVNQAFCVSQGDYADALSIVNWDESLPGLVSGSIARERMNEYKTHHKWALRTLALADYYGIQ